MLGEREICIYSYNFFNHFILISKTRAAPKTLDWTTDTLSKSASQCDFPGNDLSCQPSNSTSDCVNSCANTVGCTHYIWFSINGGTCCVKDGIVTIYNAVSVPTTEFTSTCGIMI